MLPCIKYFTFEGRDLRSVGFFFNFAYLFWRQMMSIHDFGVYLFCVHRYTQVIHTVLSGMGKRYYFQSTKFGN